MHHEPESDRQSAQKELFGLYDQLISGQSQWRSCTFLHKDIYKHFTAKVCLFRFCAVSWYILNHQKFGKTKANQSIRLNS